MPGIHEVLLSPLITEKASFASEKQNRYGFEVALRSNKHQIKLAVEKLYDVKVLNVKTSVTPGKTKRTKMSVKKSMPTKKAFVQLEAGQKIEFFKGI